MKKIALLFSAFALNFAVTAQESVVPNMDPNAPDIKFETEVLDYGVVDYDANGLREFKFTNTGKSPLTITSVSGECGCTATTIDGKKGWPEEPILPGKSGVIKVKYDTNRPGGIYKTVTVSSNAKSGNVVLTIKGNVEVKPVEEAFPQNPTPAGAPVEKKG